MKRTIIAAMVFIALAGAAAARTGVPVQDYDNQPIVRADARVLPTAKVRAAIVTATQRQKWQIGEDAPGKLVATFNIRGKHSMTVEILYTQTTYSVKYRDSHNLNYNNGTIHPAYGKQVQALVNSINAELRGA